MRRFMILPLLACLLLGFLPAVFAQEEQPGKSEDDNGYAQISIFAKALELIRQDYVDQNKTSYHDLINAAMKGMLSSLDPHSQFMDPDDFRDMQDDTRSRFN
jgi:carboxyl-terminal processing protease